MAVNGLILRFTGLPRSEQVRTYKPTGSHV